MQSLETDERIVLIEGGRDARYLLTGHLVYGLNGVLLARPFDLGARRVTGGPVPLVEGVRQAAGGAERGGTVQYVHQRLAGLYPRLGGRRPCRT